MVPVAFAFDDSPTQMTVKTLFLNLSVNDELHAMKSCLASKGDVGPNRFVAFKKPGHGEGLKEFAAFLREEGLKLDKSFAKHLADTYRASQLYHVADLRMIMATDILDSTLLRLNFYLRKEGLWNVLMRARVVQLPFELGREGLSYVGLCYFYRRLDQSSESFSHISYWISYAMGYAEGRYLGDVGSVTLTPSQFRAEIWDYVTLKKKESGRNRMAHVFSSCLEQLKSVYQIRYLTNHPERDMSRDVQEKLIRRLEDLNECPQVFAEQKRAFALQVEFLKASLSQNFTPAQAVGPPATLTEEDMLKPPGV